MEISNSSICSHQKETIFSKHSGVLLKKTNKSGGQKSSSDVIHLHCGQAFNPVSWKFHKLARNT